MLVKSSTVATSTSDAENSGGWRRPRSRGWARATRSRRKRSLVGGKSGLLLSIVGEELLADEAVELGGGGSWIWKKKKGEMVFRPC